MIANFNYTPEQLRDALNSVVASMDENTPKEHNEDSCPNCLYKNSVRDAFKEQIESAAPLYLVEMLSNPFQRLCDAILQQLCIGIQIGLTLAESHKLEELYKEP